MFEDRFVRTEDADGIYAAANDGTGITIFVPKLHDVKSQIFFRRIIKQNNPEAAKTILVAEINGVYLYITEDNKMILTTDGELR